MAPKIDDDLLNKLIRLVEEKYDSVGVFYPSSKILYSKKFFPFRAVLISEEIETGVNLLNVDSLEISHLYSPKNEKVVVGLDVNTNGTLLVSLAGEEPDTPECIIFNADNNGKKIHLDCKDIWYQGYGSSLKWSQSTDELLVINDFDEKETRVKLDLVNNLVLAIKEES